MLGGEVHTKQQQTEERKKQNRTTRNVRVVGWDGERSGGRVLGGEEEEAVKKNK